MSNLSDKNDALEPGYLPAEFVAEREQFYVDHASKKVLLGCGDDRSVTTQSSAKIAAQYADALPLSEGYASMYGAASGVAKNVLVVGVVQHGAAFVEQIGGFDGAFEKAVSGLLADNSNVLPALHSAESNENDPASFNPHAEGKVGCAYAEGVGATSALLIDENDPLIRDQARRDQIAIFGNDDHVDELLNSHQIFLEKATRSEGSEFAVGRGAYTTADVPIMILAGAHTKAKTSGLIHNFDLHKVRSTTVANEQSKDFYNQDIAIVTVATIQAFQEYNLDAELLMRAYVLDSTPVRAVLAAGDADPDLHGKLDPRNLAMGVLGDPQAALISLQSA